MLQFIPPTAARLRGIQNSEQELVHPHWSYVAVNSPQHRNLVEPFEYRNLLVWYMRAAGISTADIANHLSISRPRVNAVALYAQRQFYKGALTLDSMEAEAKRWELQREQLAAHTLLARNVEMKAAEGVLARCRHADWFVVGATLRIGRAAYWGAWEALGSARCMCGVCSLQPNGLRPYWEKEAFV